MSADNVEIGNDAPENRATDRRTGEVGNGHRHRRREHHPDEHVCRQHHARLKRFAGSK
jgi:hypothetical protein